MSSKREHDKRLEKHSVHFSSREKYSYIYIHTTHPPPGGSHKLMCITINAQLQMIFLPLQSLQILIQSILRGEKSRESKQTSAIFLRGRCANT